MVRKSRGILLSRYSGNSHMGVDYYSRDTFPITQTYPVKCLCAKLLKPYPTKDFLRDSTHTRASTMTAWVAYCLHPVCH